MNLIQYLTKLPSLRGSVDFWEKESNSFIIMEVLINVRLGVERASSAVGAIHYYYGNVHLEGTVADTGWPFKGKEIRAAGKTVYKLIEKHLKDKENTTRLSELPAECIGALSSLQRYYNRSSNTFDKLRSVNLNPASLKSITVEKLKEITGLNLPPVIVDKIKSASDIMELKLKNSEVNEKKLKDYDYVGDQLASVLLVFIFNKPAWIIDIQLKRVLFRHNLIINEDISRKEAIKVMEKHLNLTTVEEARAIHGRVNEICQLHCHPLPKKPLCNNCPLDNFPHSEF
ncbi:MAG: hypothetical protein ABRQ37_09765 [Candidatus Eremiobacterota bacterium]